MPCAAYSSSLPADGGDQGSILEQNDELVAQCRQHRTDGLRDDDDHHGGHVVQAKAAPGFHLAGVHSHQPPRMISDTYAPELMPKVSAPTMVKLRLLAKMTMLMISSCTIMGVPRMMVVYT